MNPWLIAGMLGAVILAGLGGITAGHHYGKLSQQVEDQVKFDKINADLTQQKAEAAKLLKEANARVLAEMQLRAKQQQELAQLKEKSREETNRIAAELATHELRFRAETAGCGPSSGGSGNSEKGEAGSRASTIVQLPAALTRDLRQLAQAADELKAEYAACKLFVEQE